MPKGGQEVARQGYREAGWPPGGDLKDEGDPGRESMVWWNLGRTLKV